MCCIFTCCGWMIDLIQRLWTFTMSCCISSAVCCALLTASMSGIALGYNYSLAEYIDLKETNVSVYLKRGVFDDEIADDMDWRRSGRLPVAGHIGDNNLQTGAPDEEMSLRSGRRLDDSIYESDDHNKFEGSLMKLTAKAPDATPSTEGTSSEEEFNQIVSNYPSGSIDQLKAIQSLINRRKLAAGRQPIRKTPEKSTDMYLDERYLAHIPQLPLPGNPSVRRMMGGDSARLAVPEESVGAPANWRPRVSSESFPKDMIDADYDRHPTYPLPVTLRSGPVRPTRPKAKATHKLRPTPTSTIITTTRARQETKVPQLIDAEIQAFKEKLLLDKFDAPSFKDEEFMKKLKMGQKSDDDYEDEARGIPLRRKRNTSDDKTVFNAENDSRDHRSNTVNKDESVVEKHKSIEIVNPSSNTKLLKELLRFSTS